jgi:hypothetical protein
MCSQTGMKKIVTYLILSTTKWPVFLASSGIILALVFALLNPAVTEELSFGARLAFWLFQVNALLVLIQSAQLALQKAGPFFKWPKIIQFILSGLLGATLFVPISLFLDQSVGLDEVPTNFVQVWPIKLLEEFSLVTPPAVVAWIGLNAIRSWRGISLGEPSANPTIDRLTMGDASRGVVTDESPSDRLPPSAPLPAFLELVPKYLGRDLVAISAELHYLRVYTNLGQNLILYPFGRAVEELESSSFLGVKVHRSHWVAYGHVIQVKRIEAQWNVITDTGLRVPVSRRRAAEVSDLLSNRSRADWPEAGA